MSCTTSPKNPNATDATTGRFGEEKPKYVNVNNGYYVVRSTPESRRQDRMRELNRRIRRMYSI